MEIWKLIPEHPNYEASNLGRVRSFVRKGKHGNINKTPHVLAFRPLPTGYLRVSLGRSYEGYVHSLVIKTFIGECPKGLEVNHKDGNKANNCIDNLEYITRAENYAHAARMGLTAKGEKNAGAKITAKQAQQIYDMYKTGNYTHAELGNKFGLSGGVIGDITRGIAWAHVTGGEPLSHILKLKSKKLTAEQVKDIRSKFDEGVSTKRLAVDYAISRSMVYTLINHQTWKDV